MTTTIGRRPGGSKECRWAGMEEGYEGGAQVGCFDVEGPSPVTGGLEPADGD